MASCSFSGSNHNAEGTADLKTADAQSSEPELRCRVLCAPAAAVAGTRGFGRESHADAAAGGDPVTGFGDAETVIAYALQRELQASTNLFRSSNDETRAGDSSGPDADTFTFDVALALRRPNQVHEEKPKTEKPES